MHSVGQKASPQKWIGYHFCGLFGTPFLTHTQFHFYYVQSGSSIVRAEGRHLLTSFWWNYPCRPFWISVRRLQPFNIMPNPPYPSWDSWDRLVSIGLDPIMDVMLKWGSMGIPQNHQFIATHQLLHAITMLIYAAYLIAGGTFPAMLKKARSTWMCRWDV